jgi:hypothetical protein
MKPRGKTKRKAKGASRASLSKIKRLSKGKRSSLDFDTSPAPHGSDSDGNSDPGGGNNGPVL